MSYEGYDQYLCANGHFWTQDCRDDNDVCPECKQPSVWQNAVDDTNCMRDGHIDMEQFLATPAVTATCPTCSHVSQTSPPIYRIPTMEETIQAQTYTDDQGCIHFCHEDKE